jgi:hypothetical protein
MTPCAGKKSMPYPMQSRILALVYSHICSNQLVKIIRIKKKKLKISPQLTPLALLKKKGPVKVDSHYRLNRSGKQDSLKS